MPKLDNPMYRAKALVFSVFSRYKVYLAGKSRINIH
jgi:hypothetical protein